MTTQTLDALHRTWRDAFTAHEADPSTVNNLAEWIAWHDYYGALMGPAGPSEPRRMDVDALAVQLEAAKDGEER